MLSNRLIVNLLLSITCFQFINIHNNSFIQSTEVKWTGNDNPNAPEAAKVPRSQKYWDEHNIERPDYAKTDAELAQESLGGGKSSKFSKSSNVLRLIIGALFVGSWIGIYQFGMGKKGTKLGSNIGSNISSSQGNNLLNYAMKMRNQDDHHETMEDKARKARLARFDNNNKVTKED